RVMPWLGGAKVILTERGAEARLKSGYSHTNWRALDLFSSPLSLPSPRLAGRGWPKTGREFPEMKIRALKPLNRGKTSNTERRSKRAFALLFDVRCSMLDVRCWMFLWVHVEGRGEGRFMQTPRANLVAGMKRFSGATLPRHYELALV